MGDYDWSAYDAAYEWEPEEDEFCPVCGVRECDCITECGLPPRAHQCKCSTKASEVKS